MDNTQNTEKKKILIVEDELYIRELYAQVLRDEGYIVEEASNGEDGFSMIVNNNYDLVFLDLLIPKMTGMEVLKKLKEKNLEEKISKIILLTNLDQEITIAEGISYGVRAYYVKSQNTLDKLKQEVADYFLDSKSQNQ